MTPPEGLQVGEVFLPGKIDMFVVPHAMHLDERYFERPTEFIPERWLVEPGHELYPNVKGAWRAFEHGPRNCIAQGMVMLELKMVLAMTIRQFDVKPAYEEWDRLHPGKGIKEVDGQRVYQIDEGAAHPADHFPCRVSLREVK